MCRKQEVCVTELSPTPASPQSPLAQPETLRCVGGAREWSGAVWNSPPWLLAPEIHISGRTRVPLAPERCHSKLRGRGGQSLSKAVSQWLFPRVTGEGGDSKELEPVPVMGAAPQSGGHSLNSRTAQPHNTSLQPHNQALQTGREV